MGWGKETINQWFNFGDMFVLYIVLLIQFGSLFVALNNPHYKVPPHLIQMAQEENIKLQQMR